MKTALTSVLLALAFSTSTWAAETAAPLRERVSFNREWKFQLGDERGAEASAFDDAKWENIGLPHSFSMPYFAAGNAFYVGYGWYRKHFIMPERWAGRRIFLNFEGAFQDAEIFVNGKKIGTHQGGYTGFEIDITSAVKADDNVVAVRVNNLWNPQLAPRAGEHVFSGGLYRNVWLVSTDPLHIAWYGTFVTTPNISKGSGEVNVKTEVTNQSAAERNVRLRTEVLDPNGKLVATANATRQIAAGKTVTFDQTTPPVPNPELWSPEKPTLYRVVSTVFDGDKPTDRFETLFGFRWVEWTADNGFFLNGHHRYFKGANVHQDHAGWGDAITDAAAARDVKMMKDIGFDFIRGSHYPHSPAFSQACDEQGMLFLSENCFWATYGDNKDGYWTSSGYPIKPEDQKPFEQSVMAALRDMIRIHRNHPSIVAWSMGNEDFFARGDVMPKVREFLKEAVAESHQLDPSRKAVIGGAQRGSIDKLGDIAGYNGDGARLPQFQNPGIPNIVTEYGSTSTDRPGKYEPGYGDLPRTPGADASNPDSWRLPWRSGELIWCGFDHGSIAGRRFGAMGLVDYYRLPKRAWYWYRNDYAKVPPPEWPKDGVPASLKLNSDKTTILHDDGTDDAFIVVTVVDAAGKPLSNSVPVTLAIESGPGEFPTGPSITFAPDSDIAIRDGQAAVEFRSYYAGTTRIRAISPGLKGGVLTLVTKGDAPYDPEKTPAVKPRPYRPVTERSGAGTAIVFGLNNPTRVSSETAAHSGRLANDENPETYWQASTSGTAWWQVDLERIVAIESVTLRFSTEETHLYLVEVSEDSVSWKLVTDQSHSTATAKLRQDAAATGAAGRFVRVTFPNSIEPATICEFTVRGRFAQ